jgi:hypothetical protein
MDPRGGHIRRDAIVVATALAVVVLAATLLEGNVALVALPLVTVLAAASVGAPGPRRGAAGVAVAVLGAYMGLVAHWLFYDHVAPTEHWSVSQLVVRGLVAVVLAAAGLAFAHSRQTGTPR